MTRTVSKTWHTPVLAPLLEKRSESLLLVGAGGIHLGLNLVGLPGWVCPFRAATGIPCPGCGLTTATVELLHGDLGGSLHTHAFAPLFLLAIVLMLAALVLPAQLRQRLISGLARLETRTGLMAWLLLALFVYWGFRLPGLL